MLKISFNWSIKLNNKMVSGCGAVGSALPWGGRGRKFKSCHSDQKSVRVVQILTDFFFYFCATLIYFNLLCTLLFCWYIQSTYIRGMYTVCIKWFLKSWKSLYSKNFQLFLLPLRGKGLLFSTFLSSPTNCRYRGVIITLW